MACRPAHVLTSYADVIMFNLRTDSFAAQGTLDAMDAGTRKVNPGWFDFDKETPVK